MEKSFFPPHSDTDNLPFDLKKLTINKLSPSFCKTKDKKPKSLKPILKLPSTHYSTLMKYQVPQVNDILLSVMKEATSIVDATAHVGGDALNFSSVYPDAIITAIDNDILAIECLMLNVGVYMKTDKFRIIHDDCVKYIKSTNLKADLYYFDPPWGGPTYREKDMIRLYLNEEPIETIINYILDEKLSKHIFLKAPHNFDYDQFSKNIRGQLDIFNIVKPQKSDIIAYHLIHIKNS